MAENKEKQCSMAEKKEKQMSEKKEKQCAGVAKIVIQNSALEFKYKDAHKNRYACWHMVEEDQLEDIAQNVKFFDELEKKADELKVIKLNIECHGMDAIMPGKKTYLLGNPSPMFINNVKIYLRELKKFLLKHKHIKLYINNDICFGASAYFVEHGKGYKVGDLFEDYKTELDGVLDRVVICGFKKKILVQSFAPFASQDIHTKHFSNGVLNGFLNLINVNEDARRLYKIISLLALKVAKEKGVKIPKKGQDVLFQDIFIRVLLPQILEASKLNNERKYYYFDKDGKMQKFDKDTKKAKAMKNEFLGIKKQKSPSRSSPMSLEEIVNLCITSPKK